MKKIIKIKKGIIEKNRFNENQSEASSVNKSNKLFKKKIENIIISTRESRVPLKSSNVDFKHNTLKASDSSKQSLMFNYVNDISDLNGFGIQRWNDNAKYVGLHVNGKANSYGIFFHKDGDIYRGEFKSDKAEGYAIYNYVNGAEYEGEWKNDVQQGIGIEKWKDKSKYEGDYLDGKKHGIGKYTWVDGSKYEGEWNMNNISGIGEYNFSDGRLYKGMWESNAMNGFGVLKISEDKVYCGDFSNDLKEGFGVYLWSHNSIQKIYLGFWKKGNQNGIGKYLTKTNIKYGQWSDGDRLTWYDEKQALSMLSNSSKIYLKYFQLSFEEIKTMINNFLN